jgi:putative ABC transport system permease protein
VVDGMTLLRLAARSLLSRRIAAIFAVLAVGMSVAVLEAVETLRTGTRATFAGSLSGTDVLVGPRGSGVQILLFSVFSIGMPTNTVSAASRAEIDQRPEVAWTVPVALGDSHRGFPVVGTEAAYFERVRHGRRPLAFAVGGPFVNDFDAVVGHRAAAELGYRPGSTIHLSHGIGPISFVEHADDPIRIVGVLAPSGGPADRSLFVPLTTMAALHPDHGFDDHGGQDHGGHEHGEHAHAGDGHEAHGNRPPPVPSTLTAIHVGLRSPLGLPSFQRWANDFVGEPLTAVVPAVALHELWSVVGPVEGALRGLSALMLAATLTGLATMILSTLAARRREIAILRSVGASPGHIFALLTLEAGLLTAAATALGIALAHGGAAAAGAALDPALGAILATAAPDPFRIAVILAAGVLAGSVPGIVAYRQSLDAGLGERT